MPGETRDRKAYREAHREHISVYNKAWRLAHPEYETQEARKEHKKAWELEHKEQIKQRREQRRLAMTDEDLEKRREKQREYYQAHKAERNLYMHNYYLIHNDKKKAYRAKYNNPQYKYYHQHQATYAENRHRIKVTVLTHYGNGKLACVNCGFDDIRALSIDHINGNGRKERAKLGINGGERFYYYLRKNGYPEGYQTLCMNCNTIKKNKKDIEVYGL